MLHAHHLQTSNIPQRFTLLSSSSLELSSGFSLITALTSEAYLA